MIVTPHADVSHPPLPGRRGTELQLLHGLLLTHAPDAFDRVIEATLVENLDAAVEAMRDGLVLVERNGSLSDGDRAALRMVQRAFLAESGDPPTD